MNEIARLRRLLYVRSVAYQKQIDGLLAQICDNNQQIVELRIEAGLVARADSYLPWRTRWDARQECE